MWGIAFSRPLVRAAFILLGLVRAAFSSVFGGEECVRCGRRTSLLPLCRGCAALLESSAAGTEGRCVRCGRPLLVGGGLCGKCRAGRSLGSVERTFPLWTYRAWRKRLVFLWKMEGLRSLSPLFAACVERKLREVEEAAGRSLPVVPVPPRPGKIRAEGWDQVEELSRLLELGFGRRVLRVLSRTARVQRKKLGRAERLGGIGSAYRASSSRRARRMMSPPPESAVLLDDVVTTGATLEECASLLRSLGVRRVFAVALCSVE